MRIYNSDEVRKTQEALAEAGQTDHIQYCYRCDACRRLITKLEVLEARSAGRISLCSCGSKIVRIANAKVWEEFLLPRCWKLIYAIYTKKVAPPPSPPTLEEQEEARQTAKRAQAALDAYMKNIRTRLKEQKFQKVPL